MASSIEAEEFLLIVISIPANTIRVNIISYSVLALGFDWRSLPYREEDSTSRLKFLLEF